ncbi:reverse transcriptase domain-containing protein [Tanacetum coccineum]
MGDENPIHTLGDYSKPSHEGYRNTIELSCEIDRAAGSKLRDKNADGSWEIIKNLALYDHEGWNDTKEFEADKEDEAENEPNKKAGKEETTGTPNSQPVEYYLKHRINEKLIEGLVGDHRFNDSLSGARVSEHVYPVDFVILDLKEDENRPFILGTPFLTAAKAVIKFDEGTITLRSGKSKISFHRIHESLCKIKRGVKNDIEPIAPTMTVNRLVLEWEERIKLHLEREMEFDQWKSKNFKGKHPALVKIEGGMDDEGEVTSSKDTMLNEIDRLFKEHFNVDHMNAILDCYADINAYSNLECKYLKAS